MSFDFLEGAWEGFYTYGPDYPPDFQTKREKFVMNLRIGNEIVFGTCTDTYTEKYFGEPAIVEGTFDGRFISLVKKYPGFLGIDENGNNITDKSMPSDEIHYVGQLKRWLFSADVFIEGTWDISGSFVDENGDARYYTAEGEFEMRRISSS